MNKLLFIQAEAALAATKTRKIVKDEIKYHAQQHQKAYEFLTIKKVLDNEIKALVIKIGSFINSNNVFDPFA